MTTLFNHTLNALVENMRMNDLAAHGTYSTHGTHGRCTNKTTNLKPIQH